jgi:hypothetical protein
MPIQKTSKTVSNRPKKVEKKRIEIKKPVNINKQLRLAIITRKAKILEAERHELSFLLKKATDQNFTKISKAIENNLIESEKLRAQRANLVEEKAA